MRLVLLLGLLIVAVAAEVELLVGYHEAVGIPEAARIKAAEEQIIARQGQRIVGGDFAPVDAHPYLAGLVISLVNFDGNSACGSSLLSANRLVTAAHCWFDGNYQAWQFLVVLGSQYLFSGGTRIATSQVILHSEWTPTTLTNDIAVIYISTSVTFSESIQPIALPLTTDLNQDFVGLWGVAAGYGKTSDEQLGVSLSTLVSEVNLQVITISACQAAFGPVVVQPTNICTNGTGGVGICSGDSGGPFVIERNGHKTLVGISSFVLAAGCQLGFPSGFTRVASFLNFILQHLS